MSEKPIRQNTIVSTTDKRLTLLQWLKQVQGQLKDLKDKGVKAVVEEFDTPEAFYNAYSTKPSGTPVLAIVADDTAIMGTLSEITDKLILKGTIYQGGKMYTGAEADSLTIVGSGELASASDLNAVLSSVWKPVNYANEAAFIKDIKAKRYKEGDQVYISWGKYISPTLTYHCLLIGYVSELISSGFRVNGILAYYEETNSYNWHPLYRFKLNPDITELNGKIRIESTALTQDLISSEDLAANGYFKGETFGASQLSSFDRYYGVYGVNDNPKLINIGGRGGRNLNELQGVILDTTNKEIYYGLNGYMKVSSSGVVENAISGTELKEAVRLATQKTYWHSVKIKGTNGIFTFNAPSTLNTPVVSTEKLLELFNNDTWAGFGKLGADMLFGIRLFNDNIEFTKADDTKVSLGAFGTIEISDDVKEVK